MGAGGLRSQLLVWFSSALIGTGALLWPADGAARQRIGVGVHVPGAPAETGALDRYVRKVGRQPAVVSWYRDWSDPLIFESNLRNVWQRDAVPMITWEPWRPDRSGFPLTEIAAGSYDSYLRSSARDAAAWGKPILLRFAHEMNGDWYPWGAGPNGNTPADYRRAWRHVVSVFREQGAENVRFVWSPNAEDGSTEPIEPFYPGDRWVEWAGLDGFNWGGSWGWRSLSEIFADTYRKLVRITPAPVVIGETGSNTGPGDKAEWITSAYERELPRFERMRAIVWFDDTFADRADFRLERPPAALSAYRSAIGASTYRIGGKRLIATSRSRAPTDGASELTVPSGGFGAPSLAERIREKLNGNEIWLAAAGTLALIGAGLVALRSRRARAGP